VFCMPERAASRTPSGIGGLVLSSSRQQDPSELLTEKKLIVLVPTKNEIWCIEAFLQAASLWADLIIVRDQGSADGTREMVQNFPKAVLVDNPSTVYNETDNRIALLHKARELAGPGNVLISLDADERLTPVILKENLRTQ
jgi:glycosyltransferase involved in cell wall biosynthesis